MLFNLMRMNRKYLEFMVVAGALLGMQSGVYAEDVDKFILDEVVVTASRVETKFIDTPANMSIITVKEIEERGYQSAKEALEDVPGAMVISGGFNGSEQHVFLNGEDRVLFLVNGRRMNLDRGGGHGRQAFDLRSLPSIGAIERIEVVKGASTSLYGSDAVGGVINIITKRGADRFTKLDIGHGSWGTEQYKISSGGKNQHGLGYYVTLNKSVQDYTKFRDNKTGENVRWDNTEYESKGASIRLDQEIDDDQLATITFEHTFTDAGQPYQSPGNSIKPFASSTILDNNVMGKYEWGLDGENRGYIQFFKNHNVGTSYDIGSVSEYTENKTGIGILQSWKTNEKNLLNVGFDWNDSKINNSVSFDSEKEITTKAFYLHDIFEMENGWQLSGGVRYDKHNYFGHETSGSVALNKKFNEKSNAYISWNQVFTAPNGNDLFFDSSWSKGNPNLRPETGDVLSVGYNVQTSKSTEIGINYFNSKIKDAIDWYDTKLGYWTVGNIGYQRKNGFEFNINHKISPAWSAWASYSYANVENSNNGNEYEWDDTIRPNNYKIGFRYHEDKLNLDFIGRGATGLSEKQYAASKYFTMDLAAQYQIEVNWKAYFKVYNLNNRSYSEKSGTSKGGSLLYPMAGRSVLIGVEYSF